MREPGLSRRMIPYKVNIYTFLQGIVGCILLLTTGCTATYEFTVPDGHPAKADTYEAVYEPSQTLLRTDPIDTQPARSEHWDDEDDEHEHHHDENHHDHDHDHRYNDEDMMKPQGALKFDSPFRFSDSESLAVWLQSLSLNHISNRQPKGKATGLNQNGRDVQ